jgi:hypothetical protein
MAACMRNAPDLIAKVTLLPTSQGGRRGPTPSDLQNCIMTIGDRNFDVRLHLDRIGPLRPGQAAVVYISFLDPEFAKGFVTEGVPFKLREAKVIGAGIIEELLLVN